MIKRRGPICCLLAIVLVAATTSSADAQRKQVKLLQKWSGSVKEVALNDKAPRQGWIADEKTFADLWKAWEVGEKMPKVDFTKQIVILSTTRGSRLSLFASLDDKGDLRVGGLATKDLRPGFRYQIATVARDGVKTVNGKKLTKD